MKSATYKALVFLCIFAFLSSCQEEEENEGGNVIPILIKQVRNCDIATQPYATTISSSMTVSNGDRDNCLPPASNDSSLVVTNLPDRTLTAYTGVAANQREVNAIDIEVSTTAAVKIKGVYIWVEGANEHFQIPKSVPTNSFKVAFNLPLETQLGTFSINYALYSEVNTVGPVYTQTFALEKGKEIRQAPTTEEPVVAFIDEFILSYKRGSRVPVPANTFEALPPAPSNPELDLRSGSSLSINASAGNRITYNLPLDFDFSALPADAAPEGIYLYLEGTNQHYDIPFSDGIPSEGLTLDLASLSYPDVDTTRVFTLKAALYNNINQVGNFVDYNLSFYQPIISYPTVIGFNVRDTDLLVIDRVTNDTVITDTTIELASGAENANVTFANTGLGPTFTIDTDISNSLVRELTLAIRRNADGSFFSSIVLNYNQFRYTGNSDIPADSGLEVELIVDIVKYQEPDGSTGLPGIVAGSFSGFVVADSDTSDIMDVSGTFDSRNDQ